MKGGILTKRVKSLVRTSAAFDSQFGKLSIRTSQTLHDQFMIIDNKGFYHFGVSLKDLGKRIFMFYCIEEPSVIQGLQSRWNQEWASVTVVI